MLKGARLTDSRQLLALATPIALTQLAQVALTTIDIVMIGVLGVQALAAGGLAIVLFNQVRTIGVGLITAAGNRVAELAAPDEPQALGKVAESGVRDVVRASLAMATAAGVAGPSSWSAAPAHLYVLLLGHLY
jgi:MATE family multidrug resistance protein